MVDELSNKKQKRGSASPSAADDLASLRSSLPIPRRRVWRACESCRRKKIKCDGHEPICSQCTQSNSACNWIQTKDRAALSRHYVQELEARLVQMEGLLTQVAPSPERPLPADQPAPAQSQRPSPSPSTSSSTAPPSIHAPSSYETPSYLTDPDIKQEPADPDQFGQLALDGHGQLRWIGGSSAMTLVDAFRNISSAPSRSTKSDAPHPMFLKPEPKTSVHNLYFPPTIRFNIQPRALPLPDEVEYPPRDLADKLVAAYFTHFHHTLPVVDSTAFLSQYRRLMDDRHIATPSDTGFPTVVFAVFACAARFVDDPRLESPDASEGGIAFVYYERAMMLYYIGHSATQLAHVQAFALMASFLASINSLPQSWLMCGQAVRIAQDLGLHRSPRHLMLTPIDKETRRKVWWCVYGLDRMLAVALGRPLGIDDADCDVELPLDIDDVALPNYFSNLANGDVSPHNSPASPSLMKGFNALTCLFKIAGQVLRSVYALDKCKENLDSDKMAELQASVDRLDKLLTEWCDKLPAPFKSHPQTPQQVSLGAILCSCYYAITVTLHRNFIPTSLASRSIPRSTSVAKAVTASRSCIFLAQSIKDVIPSSHWLAFFSQYLFSSAIIILLCIMHAADQAAIKTAMHEVDTAIDCLGSLETSWPGARRCKELLKELADLTLSKVREANATAPAKRDRLTIAAESLMAESTSHRSPPVRKIMPQPSNATSPPAVADNGMTQAPSPGSRKRAHGDDEMDNSDSVRLHPPIIRTSPLVHTNALPSPRSTSSSPSDARHSTRHLPTPSPVGYGPRDFPDNLSGDASTPSSSYAFGGTVPSPAQFPARWSTPRTASSSLANETAASLDFSLSNTSMEGLEPARPFQNSFGTTSSRSAPFDSAYLPPYAFPLFEDHSSIAQSPAQFDLSDLPFSGLDCIQSFGSLSDGPSVGSPHTQDTLWSQLGSSPFKMGPDLPFSLIDGQGVA